MLEDEMISRRAALGGVLSLSLVGGIVPPVSGTSSPKSASATGRTLVAFFSRTGNTRVVAGQIKRAHGTDLFEIVPAVAYPDDYEATVDQARRERDGKVEPALAARVANIAQYQVLYIGFPIWGMTAPPVIRSFLSSHDLSGKTIIPFITHGGYGPGTGISMVKELALGARVLEGFVIQADQERETLARVTRWLSSLQVD